MLTYLGLLALLLAGLLVIDASNIAEKENEGGREGERLHSGGHARMLHAQDASKHKLAGQGVHVKHAKQNASAPPTSRVRQYLSR
jgi:hypothetical protein